MTHRWRRMKFTILTGLGFAFAPCLGAVTYLESIEGDLSDDYLAPTPLVLGVGSNILNGGLDGFLSDLDLFTLTVPVGGELTAIRILEFSGGGAGSFFGLQPGQILSADPALNASFPDPIGFALLTPAGAATDQDLLPTIVVGPPFFFARPLPAGDYAGWLNETDDSSTYTIEFVVAPEPSSMTLGALIVLAVWHRRRQR